MADFIFKISPNIVLGAYASSRIGQFVHEWGKQYMLIADPVLNDTKIIEKVTKSLSDRGIEFFVFDEIPSAPDTEVIDRALSLAKKAHVHGILAVGGMKAACVGRTVASLYHENHDIYDFLDGARPSTAPLPFIFLLSTIRDPYLFSDRNPLVDARTKQLKLLKVQPGLCKLAVFDPNLLVSLTENQIASMSLQSLCLACESYISQKANFFSDTIVEKSVEMFAHGLDGTSVLNTSVSKEQFLTQAGCMASLAAGTTSIGAASLLGEAVHGRFKIATSLTTSILFPYILEDAAKYKTDKIAKLARIMKISSETSDNDSVVANFIENIRNRIAIANLPARLKDLSVSVEELALAAEDAAKVEYANFMPRSMTADDFFDIIKQAY
ncbi:MAG TPA: iron-containing alcohol dehydrogenase [Treponemataceae bacterium]|nr:iron-containing alcohol dehydrogenase [Treponemataceae bacterium]